MRRLTAVLAAGMLLAAPAAAQTPMTDPATRALVEMLDLCLSAMKGEVVFDKGASKKAYNRSHATGGWDKKVGKSRLALNLAVTNLPNGSFRVCSGILSPATVDLAGLRVALAERAAGFPMRPMGPRPNKAGGTISGFENPDGPLISLTITEQPAAGETPATTGLSVIWRQS